MIVATLSPALAQARLSPRALPLADAFAETPRTKLDPATLGTPDPRAIEKDVAALLDLSKVNLEDEAKALEVLAKFAKPATGQQVKPGAVGATGLTDAELRQRYFGGQQKSSIFGG